MTEQYEDLLQVIISLQKENVDLKRQLLEITNANKTPVSLSSLQSLSNIRSKHELSNPTKGILDNAVEMVLRYAKATNFH
jgi:hypothetical protein